MHLDVRLNIGFVSMCASLHGIAWHVSKRNVPYRVQGSIMFMNFDTTTLNLCVHTCWAGARDGPGGNGRWMTWTVRSQLSGKACCMMLYAPYNWEALPANIFWQTNILWRMTAKSGTPDHPIRSVSSSQCGRRTLWYISSLKIDLGAGSTKTLC